VRPTCALPTCTKQTIDQWPLSLAEALPGKFRHGMGTIETGGMFGGLES